MSCILVCDDHPLFRRGLRQVLLDEVGATEVGEAANTQEAIVQIQDRKWDLLVLDLSLPGRSGLDALQEIRQLRPKLPVLILTMYPETQYAVRALKCGAAGYLVKGADPRDLLQAIRKVLGGGRYISPEVADCLTRAIGADGEAPPHERLSDREYQVFRALGSGKTVSEVAERMSLSVKTVSTYRARILQKLGLNTTAEIIRYAVTHGLAD